MKAPSAATDCLQTMIRSAGSAPNKSFPCTLHRMLNEIDNMVDCEEGASLHKIICWEEHGLGFKIHNRKKFMELVMPIWFPRLKYSSWVRQLNTFGFKRVLTDGKDKSSVFHEEFLRDQPEMAANIKRVPKKKSKKEHNKESLPTSDTSTSLPVPTPPNGLPGAVSNMSTKEPPKSLAAPTRSNANGLHNLMFQNVNMPNRTAPPTSLFSQVQDGFLGMDIFVTENADLDNDEGHSSFINGALSNAFHDVWNTLENDDSEPLPFHGIDNDEPLPLDEPLDENLFYDNIEPLRVFAPGFDEQ